jgi:hypothetical protein
MCGCARMHACRRVSAAAESDNLFRTTSLETMCGSQAGARLVALNLSQQSDSSDLLGGFRPVEPGEGFRALAARFADLLSRTYPRASGQNRSFLAHAAKLAAGRKWKRLLQAFRLAIKKVRVFVCAAFGTRTQVVEGYRLGVHPNPTTGLGYWWEPVPILVPPINREHCCMFCIRLGLAFHCLAFHLTDNAPLTAAHS